MTYVLVEKLITYKRSPLLKQTWAMLAIYLSVLSNAIIHQPPTHPGNLQSDHDITLSRGNLLDFTAIATIAGSVASSILMGIIGRKWAFIAGTLTGILSCSVANFAPRMYTLRMTLNGFSTGFTVILGWIIISEYTSPKYRGVFLNFLSPCMNFGNTICVLFPSKYHWELMMTALLLQTVSLGITTAWPESPYWLSSKKEYEKSEIAFHCLRDTTCKKELVDLIARCKIKKLSNYSLVEKIVIFLKKYSSSDFLRPVIVVIFGTTLIESSGKHFLTVTSSEVVQLLEMDLGTYETQSNVLVSLSSVVTLLLVLIFKHKSVLLTTGSLSSVLLFLTSFYVFLVSNHLIDKNWLGPLLFLMQLVVSNLGSTSIPLALIGEVFPLAYKTLGSIVSGVIFFILPWAVLKSTPNLLSTAHLEGVLVIFGASMTISLLVMFFIMPETKNRSLLDIEDSENEYCFKDEVRDELHPKPVTIPLLLVR